LKLLLKVTNINESNEKLAKYRETEIGGVTRRRGGYRRYGWRRENANPAMASASISGCISQTISAIGSIRLMAARKYGLCQPVIIFGGVLILAASI